MADEHVLRGTDQPALSGAGAPAASRLAAPRRRRRRANLAWLGAVPFLLYVSLFLLVPALELVVNAFRTTAGGFTGQNLATLLSGQYLSAYETSVKVSVATAVIGGVVGFLIANAILSRGVPGWLRPLFTTFSGVAANFGGIPLAFAFIATIGTTGVITEALRAVGVDVYADGFSLYGVVGLSITYLYFQFPLMLLLAQPALEGLRPQWREAVVGLGGGSITYWRRVALPILLPSVLGMMILLFGSAFSAYATPYALSSGQINLVPILIGNVFSGNVTTNPNLGDALALGMIAIIGVAVVLYTFLQRWAGRWRR